ncbi:hypothetical protein HYH02_002043 [Chlamydomonas schloesseri]|uniref:Uncharacterized protein n=1 Tax=Chlamydomonas schloesseri TaxID=2026947 RepID=A0A835WUE9_9CHLO|nr:hypothetical protein HYH02_002043 [Chlamydomonas schloesseri]|eukprot:KAG2453836.1 hypothetical protein HYH02_002043 [Chlamydomonas schloesseri]
MLRAQGRALQSIALAEVSIPLVIDSADCAQFSSDDYVVLRTPSGAFVGYALLRSGSPVPTGSSSAGLNASSLLVTIQIHPDSGYSLAHRADGNVQVAFSRSVPNGCPGTQPVLTSSRAALDCTKRKASREFVVPLDLFNCSAHNAVSGYDDYFRVFFVQISVELAAVACAAASLTAYAGSEANALDPGCSFAAVTGTCRPATCPGADPAAAEAAASGGSATPLTDSGSTGSASGSGVRITVRAPDAASANTVKFTVIGGVVGGASGLGVAALVVGVVVASQKRRRRQRLAQRRAAPLAMGTDNPFWSFGSGGVRKGSGNGSSLSFSSAEDSDSGSRGGKGADGDDGGDGEERDRSTPLGVGAAFRGSFIGGLRRLRSAVAGHSGGGHGGHGAENSKGHRRRRRRRARRASTDPRALMLGGGGGGGGSGEHAYEYSDVLLPTAAVRMKQMRLHSVAATNRRTLGAGAAAAAAAASGAYGAESSGYPSAAAVDTPAQGTHWAMSERLFFAGLDSSDLERHRIPRAHLEAAGAGGSASVAAGSATSAAWGYNSSRIWNVGGGGPDAAAAAARADDSLGLGSGLLPPPHHMGVGGGGVHFFRSTATASVPPSPAASTGGGGVVYGAIFREIQPMLDDVSSAGGSNAYGTRGGGGRVGMFGATSAASAIGGAPAPGGSGGAGGSCRSVIVGGRVVEVPEVASPAGRGWVVPPSPLGPGEAAAAAAAAAGGPHASTACGIVIGGGGGGGDGGGAGSSVPSIAIGPSVAFPSSVMPSVSLGATMLPLAPLVLPPAPFGGAVPAGAPMRGLAAVALAAAASSRLAAPPDLPHRGGKHLDAHSFNRLDQEHAIAAASVAAAMAAAGGSDGTQQRSGPLYGAASLADGRSSAGNTLGGAAGAGTVAGGSAARTSSAGGGASASGASEASVSLGFSSTAPAIRTMQLMRGPAACARQATTLETIQSSRNSSAHNTPIGNTPLRSPARSPTGLTPPSAEAGGGAPAAAAAAAAAATAAAATPTPEAAAALLELQLAEAAARAAVAAAAAADSCLVSREPSAATAGGGSITPRGAVRLRGPFAPALGSGRSSGPLRVPSRFGDVMRGLSTGRQPSIELGTMSTAASRLSAADIPAGSGSSFVNPAAVAPPGSGGGGGVRVRAAATAAAAAVAAAGTSASVVVPSSSLHSSTTTAEALLHEAEAAAGDAVGELPLLRLPAAATAAAAAGGAAGHSGDGTAAAVNADGEISEFAYENESSLPSEPVDEMSWGAAAAAMVAVARRHTAARPPALVLDSNAGTVPFLRTGRIQSNSGRVSNMGGASPAAAVTPPGDAAANAATPGAASGTGAAAPPPPAPPGGPLAALASPLEPAVAAAAALPSGATSARVSVILTSDVEDGLDGELSAAEDARSSGRHSATRRGRSGSRRARSLRLGLSSSRERGRSARAGGEAEEPDGFTAERAPGGHSLAGWSKGPTSLLPRRSSLAILHRPLEDAVVQPSAGGGRRSGASTPLRRVSQAGRGGGSAGPASPLRAPLLLPLPLTRETLRLLGGSLVRGGSGGGLQQLGRQRGATSSAAVSIVLGDQDEGEGAEPAEGGDRGSLGRLSSREDSADGGGGGAAGGSRGGGAAAATAGASFLGRLRRAFASGRGGSASHSGAAGAEPVGGGGGGGGSAGPSPRVGVAAARLLDGGGGAAGGGTVDMPPEPEERFAEATFSGAVPMEAMFSGAVPAAAAPSGGGSGHGGLAGTDVDLEVECSRWSLSANRSERLPPYRR